MVHLSSSTVSLEETVCLGLNLSCLYSFFCFLHVCPLLSVPLSVQFFAFSLCSLSFSFFLPLSLYGRSRRCNWLCCCWGFVLRRALIFSFTQNAKWRLEAVRDFTRLPVCVCVCVCACLTFCSNKLHKVWVYFNACS